MKISRRDFIAQGVFTGGGLIVGTKLAWARNGNAPDVKVMEEAARETASLAQTTAELNAWIHVRGDGEIHFILDKVEMGQGVMTGLTAIVAEEMDVSLYDIKVDFAPPGTEYGNPKMFFAQITGGSTSVASSWDRLREAVATAKAMLLHAAGGELKTKADKLSINHEKTGAHGHAYFISGTGTKRMPIGDAAIRAGQYKDSMLGKLSPVKGTPKSPREYRLLHKDKQLRRYDALDKVTGKAKYGIDTNAEIAGTTALLSAAVVRCPAPGGKLTGFSPRNATDLGITCLVPLKGGVACVAPTFWEALAASRKINAKWDFGSAAKIDTDALAAQYRNAVQQRGAVACVDSVTDTFEKTEEDVNASAEQVGGIFEAPYVPHSTMEPMNCTVHFKGDTCEIWVPTQAPAAAREIARQITGLSHDKVKVNTTFLGGGFGRRIYQDYVAEAVQISFDMYRKHGINQPVKIIWTREDDFAHDYYRPMMAHKVRASLDKNQNIAAWSHHTVGQSIFSYISDVFLDSLTIGVANPAAVKAIANVFGDVFKLKPIAIPGGLQVGLADPTSIEGLVTGAVVPDREHFPFARRIPYALGRFHLEYTHIDARVPVGFWRSVGHSHTAFVIESVVDELAKKAGRDPLEFRQHLLKEALNSQSLIKKWGGSELRIRRSAGVLEAVKKLSGWGRSLPDGRSLGVAQHESFDTYAAVCIEASVETEPVPPGRKAAAKKTIKVHKAFVAVDCGFALTPDLIRSQAESAVIFGLSAALKQKITIKGGVVQQTNFQDCDPLRMFECPQIEVVIIESSEPPSGVGEPCVPPVAPALRNAVYAATGVPLRRLPLDLNNP